MSDAVTHSGSRLPSDSLCEEIARQLVKDFASCGIELLPPDSPCQSCDEFLSRMAGPAVRELVRRQRPLLMKVIYRVDIPESQLGKALENLPEEEAAQTLTAMIIARERQKIHLRRSFT
jgi:hypothetical protein